MADYITIVIDSIQEMHEEIVSAKSIKAPCLAEYPSTSDSARCPIILTHVENATFGRMDEDSITVDLVSRCLFAPFGQGRFGDTMHNIHAVMDDLITHYTDDARYQQVGRRVIRKEPIEVSITGGDDAFSIGGYQVIDYPDGFGMFYHGFEMRFTASTSLAPEDC